MIDEKKLIDELEKQIVTITTPDNPEIRTKYWNAGIKYALNSIERQPKVGEWIPCSERLPEEDGWYIETVVCGSIERAGFGLFKKGMWVHFDGGIETVAWMPLPNAYNAERGGENE